MSDKLIARAAMLLLTISILARLLGFVREQVLAAFFGTSGLTDAYLMAYTLPNFIFVIIGGALATAFLPVITALEVSEGEKKELKLASSVINITVLALLFLVIVGEFFAPLLIAGLAHGFSADQRELAVNLTRIMFPCAIFLTLSVLLGALLNSFKSFAVPAATSLVFSASLIAAMYILVPGMGIYGLALGTLIAAGMQVVIQVPALKRQGFRYHPAFFDLKDSNLRKVASLMLPAMIGTSVLQVYVTIDRILASMLIEGSISALNYANKLTMFPYNLFVMTVNTAVYPYLAEHAAKGEYKEMGEATVFGLNLIAIFTLPASVGLAILSTPIVKLLFERGAFDGKSTEMTVFALIFFSVGLFAQGSFNVINRTYFAMQDTMTPVKVSLLVVGLNLIFSLLLIGPMRHGGLALANSLSSICNMVVIYFFLRRRLPELPERRLFTTMTKIFFAGGLMGIVVFAVHRVLQGVLTSAGIVFLASDVFISIAAGMLVYAIVLLSLRIEEVDRITGKIRKKMRLTGNGVEK